MGSLLLLGLSVASCPNSTESFPCTSMPFRAFSSSVCGRSFSLRSLAFSSFGLAGGRPARAWPVPPAHPGLAARITHDRVNLIDTTSRADLVAIVNMRVSQPDLVQAGFVAADADVQQARGSPIRACRGRGA